MGTSLTLFRFRGIEVRIHWSFALILVYGAFFLGSTASGSLLGPVWGIFVILLLFACVTLHEFGHALVAQYYGVKVPSITLLPIGGVANLERIPDKPVQEFLIAIAGPMVNFAIVIVLVPFALLAVWLSTGNVGDLINLQYLISQGRTPSVTGLLTYLITTNLLLGIFNLLPAFPMDGGRILRALLAMIMPYVQATNIAVMVGRLMAGLLFMYGISTANIFMMMIAFFIYVGGGSEREAVQSRAVLRNIRARDALTPNAASLYTSEQLTKAVELLMNSYQTDYPVLDLSSRFVGVLTRQRLVRALQEQGAETRVVDVMIKEEAIPTCSPETDLAEVWEKMAQTGSRVIAVKEKNQFLGLLTIDDITEVFQVVGATMQADGQPSSNILKPMAQHMVEEAEVSAPDVASTVSQSDAKVEGAEQGDNSATPFSEPASGSTMGE